MLECQLSFLSLMKLFVCKNYGLPTDVEVAGRFRKVGVNVWRVIFFESRRSTKDSVRQLAAHLSSPKSQMPIVVERVRAVSRAVASIAMI